MARRSGFTAVAESREEVKVAPMGYMSSRMVMEEV
jgi:hypothetical protein